MVTWTKLVTVEDKNLLPDVRNQPKTSGLRWSDLAVLEVERLGKWCPACIYSPVRDPRLAKAGAVPGSPGWAQGLIRAL